jgi:hypothetical protein
MAKDKVTVTLNAATLAALRELVGGRSLSAEVERAVSERVAKLRNVAAVAVHGPVSPDTLDWAAREVAKWASASMPKRRRAD